MKKYISSAVSIDNLRTQFAPDMDDKTFKELIEIDPSADFEKNKGGKYCPWIFRQYNKGNLNIVNDGTNLKDALGYFLLHYKKYPKSDLGQYKTVEEFLTDTEVVGNRELTDKEKAKLLKKQAHHASTEDKKFCVEDGAWEVWSPLTYPGSISLAREGGTKATWCTAYEGDDYYYKRYTRQGPLYIFLNTSDPNEKYQLHFESNSWFDINDHSLGMRKFYAFCEEHPAIQEYFEIKSENGVQTRAGSIVGYDENATEVIIPDGVSNLYGGGGFPTNVEKIVLPNSIPSLQENQFSGLSKLKEVKLPDSIKEIPPYAFKECTSLESIDIPNSVKVYREYAFKECTSLKTIKHSSSLVYVADGCFQNCTSWDGQLPDSVKFLGKQIFRGSEVSSISIPSNVTQIVNSAFANSQVIKDVDLANVIDIQPNAFRITTLENINLSKVTNIGANAFRGCMNLGPIELNSDGVTIGANAFTQSGVSGLVTINENTHLGIDAFNGCSNLTVEWDAPDDDYEFEGIKLLICDEAACPKLIKANKGYIEIETTSGQKYPIEE